MGSFLEAYDDSWWIIIRVFTSPGGVWPNASSTTSAGTDMTSSSVRTPSWSLSSIANR